MSHYRIIHLEIMRMFVRLGYTHNASVEIEAGKTARTIIARINADITNKEKDPSN